MYAALRTRLGISFCMCDLCTVSAAVCGHSNGPVGRSAFFSLSRMKRHWSCFHLGTPRRSTKIAPFFFQRSSRHIPWAVSVWQIDSVNAELGLPFGRVPAGSFWWPPVRCCVASLSAGRSSVLYLLETVAREEVTKTNRLKSESAPFQPCSVTPAMAWQLIF